MLNKAAAPVSTDPSGPRTSARADPSRSSTAWERAGAWPIRDLIRPAAKASSPGGGTSERITLGPDVGNPEVHRLAGGQGGKIGLGRYNPPLISIEIFPPSSRERISPVTISPGLEHGGKTGRLGAGEDDRLERRRYADWFGVQGVTPVRSSEFGVQSSEDEVQNPSSEDGLKSEIRNPPLFLLPTPNSEPIAYTRISIWLPFSSSSSPGGSSPELVSACSEA